MSEIGAKMNIVTTLLYKSWNSRSAFFAPFLLALPLASAIFSLYYIIPQLACQYFDSVLFITSHSLSII